MKKILVSTSSFNSKESFNLQKLQSYGYEIIYNPYGRRLTQEEIKKFFLDYEIVGMIAGLEELSRDVLISATALKVISRCGTAIENIDSEYAKQKNIQIFNSPEAPSVAVAELVLGLILNALRHITTANQNMKQGIWKPLLGDLLSKKVIGIIGYGCIGKKVAALCRAFNAKVVVFDIQPAPTSVNDIDFISFDELIKVSDIISLHVPLTKTNQCFINESVLSKMKTDAVLVNTARGKLIDEMALYAILKARPSFCAALDVYVEEPYRGPLAQLPNVILTSHMGSYAKSARLEMENESINNLLIGLENVGLLQKQLA